MSRLEQIVSVRQVAQAAGWSYRRMLRHLQARDRELHGMLLVKQGEGGRTRYSLTMSALEKLHPQWFQRVSSLTTRVEELENRCAELEGLVLEAHRAIGEIRGKMALEGRGLRSA